MIGGIFSVSARDAWTTVPGRSCEAVNNSDGNPLTLIFKVNNVVAFVQHYTYDENGNFLKCECQES